MQYIKPYDSKEDFLNPSLVINNVAALTNEHFSSSKIQQPLQTQSASRSVLFYEQP